jgi:hypothetical protein
MQLAASELPAITRNWTARSTGAGTQGARPDIGFAACAKDDESPLGVRTVKKSGRGKYASLDPNFQIGKSTRVSDVLEVALRPI